MSELGTHPCSQYFVTGACSCIVPGFVLCLRTWSSPRWRSCRNSVVVKAHVGAGLTRSLTPREPDAAAARAALQRHACRQAMARCAFESRGRGDVALAICCCARRAGRRLRPGGEQPSLWTAVHDCCMRDRSVCACAAPAHHLVHRERTYVSRVCKSPACVSCLVCSL